MGCCGFHVESGREVDGSILTAIRPWGLLMHPNSESLVVSKQHQYRDTMMVIGILCHGDRGLSCCLPQPASTQDNCPTIIGLRFGDSSVGG